MAKQRNRGDLAPTVILLRALRGWSRTQLADASGVARSQIYRYELGREIPSARTLERLAAAIGLPLLLLGPMTAFIRRLRDAMAGEGLPDDESAEPVGLTPETKQALLEAMDRAVIQARAELKLYASRRAAQAKAPGSE